MRTLEEITCLLHERKQTRSPLIERMREISAHYNNQITMPVAGSSKGEQVAVANLIAQGIDQHANRVASVPAELTFPPARSGQKSAEEKARKQRRAAMGWWEINEMDLFDRRRARWLVAYSTSPVLIRPDTKTQQPVWELRSPLATYPAVGWRYDDMTPSDVVFTYTQPFRWLMSNYPGYAHTLNQNMRQGKEYKPDTLIPLIEYVDGDERVLAVSGVGGLNSTAPFTSIGIPTTLGTMGQGSWAVELERSPNLTGICPVVIPGRITLDTPKGQFDDTLGIFQMQAKLMALEVDAVAESVWPDTYFVDDGNGEVVQVADGRAGIIGHVKGGTIQTQNIQPGFQTYQTLDRLERAMRLNGALPPEFGGESGTNIRTDRRGLSVLSSAIDFYIQEHQNLIARAKKHELERAIAVDYAYFKNHKKSFYVAWGKERGRIDYTPADLWAGDRTVLVEYSYAGMDANGITVTNGQRLGLGIKSKRSAMLEDPSIKDPDAEHGMIIAEGIEAALLSAVQNQAASGQIVPTDVARLMRLVKDGNTDLADAVEQVHREAQERQARIDAQGNPATVPDGSPEAMPGLAQAGMGQEQPTVQGPPQGMKNLREILNSLAAGQRMRGTA